MPADAREASPASRAVGSGRMGAKQRVGLLGAGYIAEWHAKSIASVANVELAAVCDSVLPRASALAARFGVPGVYRTLEEMLTAEQLDAVHVLLPPDRHFEAARTVLEAGANVFVEKPMCASAADCQRLVRLAEERGLRIGVGNNFLFADPYEQLRRDVRGRILGQLDDVVITWRRPLPQLIHGPFDTWMLRDPRNILLEIGAHLTAQMLDLVGEPEEMRVHPSNRVELPTGTSFYRRWQVTALKGKTSVQLNFSFVPGFSEFAVHARGSLAAATADFERNTYTLHQYTPRDQDFDSYAMLLNQAASLKRQARRTLREYVLAKLHLGRRGNPYGASISAAMQGFYGPSGLDDRLSGRLSAKVVELCEQMGDLAGLPYEASSPRAGSAAAPKTSAPRILVLGAGGFIGKELVRQLAAGNRPVRLLLRGLGNLPSDLRSAPHVECRAGDLMDKEALRRSLEGVDCVFHLARASVKSWADYRQFDIEMTRQVAEAALEAGVKRFIYTGTIDSYYAGRKAGTITEATPLDARIDRRNLYARAKAEAEAMLWRMHGEQGLPLVILRPGIVIGRGGSPFHWGVGRWWNDAICQTWGQGRNKLPLVLVEDVARGLIAAMEKPGIEGQSFNLIADPCLSAQEYLDELDRLGSFRVQRVSTRIVKFYLNDMLKWIVKVAVRHPERRIPSYRDWESRTQRAHFDCTVTRQVLGWNPVGDRDEMVRKGIEEPLSELMR